LATLKTNILANLLGSVWVAVLTIIITPLQVRLLGIEAYGLVGLIAVLQVVLGTCDLGLSATLTQRVAADSDKDSDASRTLVNSASTLYWGLAVVLAVLLCLNADWIAIHWLKPSALDPATVTLSLRIIAFYLALRWPVAFYTGLISGLQRLDILNLIKSGVVSLRLLGGVLVLLVLPNLIAFLLWFAISALLELMAYAIVAHRLMPGLSLRPSCSWTALKSVWKFSAAMSLIAVLSMLLTQVDRLMISTFLSLEALGYYALAYHTAMALSLLQTALNSAAFPALSGSHGSERSSELLARYNKTSQLMGYVIAAPCFALVFFGHDILRWWISPAAANGASIAMALLALGFFINAMVSNAYIAAVACGKPGLPLKVNLAGAVLYLPALYGLIQTAGINGAALCWLALNLYYLATLFPLVQRGVLRQAVWPWLRTNLLPFLAAGLLLFGGMKGLAILSGGWLVWAVLATLVYAGLGYRCLAPELRAHLRALFGQLRSYVPGVVR